MKLLQMVWGMENGGAENMLADIINTQVCTDDVSLLVINDMLDSSILERINKKCKFIFLRRKVKSKNFKSIWTILKMNLIVLFGRYDIIHLHQGTTIEKLFVPANYVRTVHNTNQDKHNYRWHKAIIAISESVKKELDSLGYKNSILVNNGINFELIKTRDNYMPSDTFKIVQVSRILYRQKGQDILLAALADIVKSGISHIHLDFIGEGPDFEDLKYKIDKYNLTPFVSLLGNRSREYIYNNLAQYDLFVQPSRFEGFGLTVVEAMAAKIPVLVSQNEGPLQIIDNGEYGYDFPNGNVKALAGRIVSIMRDYPKSTYLNNAYNYAKNTYSVENTAKAYLKIYKNILN